MVDENITEAQIWADIDKEFYREPRQPGDIDIQQFAAHYGISETAARRRMNDMKNKGGYQVLTVMDDTSSTGKRVILRKVRK